MDFIKRYWKKFLFAVLFICLFVPLLVKSLNLVNEQPLGGVTYKIDKPILTDSTWFNGEFQILAERYINENIGLRGTVIRINNQIDFTFYKKTGAEKVVIGKDNYLYENNYIDAYLGTDYIGDEKINSLSNQAKKCEEILEDMSIKLLFVFAPGKASFYPEYITENYPKLEKSTKTNYKEFKKSLQSNNLNYIDFNSWFINMKDTSTYPLFPKAGIHWSYYGMYLCADSLIKKVEKDINKDLPELSLENLEISSEQRHTEYDLGNLMNLYYPIKTYDLAYPSYSYNKEGKYRPNVLVVGDSFYWNMYYSGIPGNVFNGLNFFYYNSKYFNDGTDKYKAEIKNLDFLEEISKYEYIIILQTDGGLNNFGFGFFNKLLSVTNMVDLSPEVKEIIQNIKNDQNWMMHIEQKAKERGISVDEMLVIDAEYMLSQQQ